MIHYAKLIDGQPQFAPNPILAGSDYIGNPPGTVYLAQGFKPVTGTACPAEAPQPGFRWEAAWSETAEAILCSWTQVPIPPDEELSGQEALDILMGGGAT